MVGCVFCLKNCKKYYKSNNCNFPEQLKSLVKFVPVTKYYAWSGFIFRSTSNDFSHNLFDSKTIKLATVR